MKIADIKRYFKHNFKIVPFTIALFFTLVALYAGQMQSWMYSANVLDLPAHKPFDGTVYPVELVPDYTKLTEAERNFTYNQLPSSKLIPIPKYDPAVLKKDFDSLKWGDRKDDEVRNAKITYSVPYMGNYKLDGLENVGSHAAVDIKIPKRTPLRAVANGTVWKVSNQSSGFGKHVVIEHKNVPSPDNVNKKVTLYSSYSHNDENLVKVGDVVDKGDIIAYSGDTGTTTTPHVHFQLDNEESDWHPYWPFTSSEASNAGLSFFEAINAGLGSNKALKATEHPLNFVQNHLDDNYITVNISNVADPIVGSSEEVLDVTVNVKSPTASSIVESEKAESRVQNAESRVQNEKAEVVESQKAEVKSQEVEEVMMEVKEVEPPRFAGFAIDVEDTYDVEKLGSFVVKTIDQYGNIYDGSFEGEVTVKSQDGNATAKYAILTSRRFEDGKVKNTFRRMAEGDDRMLISYNGETYYSDRFDVVDYSELSYSDVPKWHEQYDEFEFLKEEGIMSGYPDGTMKPEKIVSRVEAAKLIVLTLGLEEKDLPKAADMNFPDGDKSQWYAPYVAELAKRGILNGDDRGRLLPVKEVNGAEFLKMLFVALEVEVDENAEGLWFEKYVEKAVEMGVVNKNFKPEKGLSRGDVAEIIYKIRDNR